MGFIKSLFINSTLNARVAQEMSVNINLQKTPDQLQPSLDSLVNHIFTKHYSNSCFVSWRKSAIKSSLKQHICEKQTNEIAIILKEFNDRYPISGEGISAFVEHMARNSLGYLSIDEIKDTLKNNHKITSILVRNNIISKGKHGIEIKPDKIPRSKNIMKEINGNIYLAKHLESYSQLRCLSQEDLNRKYFLYCQYRDFLTTGEVTKDNEQGYHTYVKTEEYEHEYNPKHESFFADFYNGKITLAQLDDAFMVSFEDKFSKKASRFLQTITVDSTTKELINHGEFVYKTLKSISKAVSSGLENRRVTLDDIKRFAGQNVSVSKERFISGFLDNQVENKLGKSLTADQKAILLKFTEIFDEKFIRETHLYCKIKKPKSDSVINLIGKHFFNDTNPKKSPVKSTDTDIESNGENFDPYALTREGEIQRSSLLDAGYHGGFPQ